MDFGPCFKSTKRWDRLDEIYQREGCDPKVWDSIFEDFEAEFLVVVDVRKYHQEALLENEQFVLGSRQ